MVVIVATAVVVAVLHALQVHVIASLPCYGAENVDKQRGRGVFERSIEVRLAQARSLSM
jgi:hypothetical protein